MTLIDSLRHVAVEPGMCADAASDVCSEGSRTRQGPSELLVSGAPNWQMLDILCDPARELTTGNMAFCSGSQDKALTPFNDKEDVTLRPEQRQVLDALQHRLELVQGPPG